MTKILLVGEQVNKKKSKTPFDRNYSTGKFLLDSLMYLSPCLTICRGHIRYYFDNAIVNDRVNNKLVNRSKGKLVIALGNISDKILTDLKIKHCKIPHPSYFKRFKSKEGYQGYSRLIYKEIMK